MNEDEIAFLSSHYHMLYLGMGCVIGVDDVVFHSNRYSYINSTSLTKAGGGGLIHP